MSAPVSRLRVNSPSLSGSLTQRTTSGACRSVLIVAVMALFSVLGSQPVAAQKLEGFKDQLGLKLPGQDLDEPEIKATVKVEPKSAQPGDTVTLSFKVELPPGSWTYSMNPAFGGAARVKFESETGLVPQGDFVADHAPKTQYSPEFKQDLEKFTTEVTWSRKYRIDAGATAANLKGTLHYQVCDDKNCRNLKEKFDLRVDVDGAPAAIPAREAAATDLASRLEFTPRLPTQKSKTPHTHAAATVRVTPVDARPGDVVNLEFQVKLEEGWHIFSTSQPEGQSATATEFDITSHEGLEPIDPEFVAPRQFSIHKINDGKKEVTQEIYENEITWTRKFRLLPEANLANIHLQGKILFQICKDNVACIMNTVKFDLPSGSDESATPPSGNPPEPSRGGPEVVAPPTPAPGDTVATAPEAAKPGFVDLSEGECSASTSEGDIRDRGVLYVLGAAFAFGWLALLTPCVFPMVPITVSFFLKQSEKKNASPVKLAVVYCLSIIGTFTVLGLIVSALFGATYINSLANGVAINLFLGIVLLFFALNLLGLFDIQIPSWLLTFTASKESASSYFGVFFMALTFTLTSFTCTFAFLGLILVWAANGEFWWPLGGLIAFSTAFAMPFFLLALFPSYLQKLPKSGGWMNRVKVVMGLIELAFMFKFLSVADVAWNSTPTLLDYHLVMSAWMAISIVAGLYLLGKIQLPHDTKEEYVGVIPMVVALGFFGLAGYLGVGIFGHEPPGGFFGQQIIAFAPPRFEGGVGEDGPYLVDDHDHQRYLLDYESAKAKAKREGLPLFIDFTGVNCINCRKMERMMADSSAIQGNLQKLVRVKLYTDIMPKEAVGDLKRSEELLEYNGNLQETWLKDATLPGYAVVSPDGTVIFSKIKGVVPESNFNTFLECGLNKSKSKGNSLTAMTKP